MAHIRVYDPAVCCSTGVCSPEADASIAQFTAALDKAKKSGVEVDRFTLAHQPAEYVANATVKTLLDDEGIDVLPIVFLGDEILSKGGYPDRGDLMRRLSIEDSAGPSESAASCCGPTEKAESGCC